MGGNGVGGLTGIAYNSTLEGYALGWVVTTNTTDVSDNTVTNTIGAVIGETILGGKINAYYNNTNGQDRVGDIGESADGHAHNGIGKAINGVLEATTNNMPELTEGTNVGTWVFTPNKWPKINLPNIVTSVLDLEMVGPDRPKGFVD